MITDKDILNYFIKPSGIITSAAIKNAPGEYIEYLNNRYSDSKSIKETIRRIEHNIEVRPICPNCGKEVPFIGLRDKLFGIYCCNYCQTHSAQRLEKTKETCIKKYGCENQNQNKEIREKTKKTCLERYGADCVGTIKEFHKKRIETNFKKYGYYYNLEKYKETCKKRYGNEYAIASEHCKQKAIQTRLERYGVEQSSQIPSVIEATKHNKERIQHIYETKRKNHTLNTSKPEDDSYILLTKVFKNVIRQYTSDLYPYNCDFYIPEINTYLECNYFWTHGGHPYNNSENDIKQLNEWKEQAKNSNFYKNAIETWTIRDVAKRNTAKQNNLNYIEVWNIEELKNIINKYEINS